MCSVDWNFLAPAAALVKGSHGTDMNANRAHFLAPAAALVKGSHGTDMNANRALMLILRPIPRVSVPALSQASLLLRLRLMIMIIGAVGIHKLDTPLP
jgi:hypothetical protein